MDNEASSSSALSKERYLMIQLLKWLKREYLENMASRSALQTSVHVYAEATNTILQEKSVQMEVCERAANAVFRRAELALCDPQDDLSALAYLLSKHSPRR